MDDYVSKPIEPAHFFEVIQRNLGSSGSGMPPTSADDSVSEAIELDAKVIDIEAARRICGGDEGRLTLLASTLVEEADDLMCRIHDAVKSRDWKVLHRCAHTMKGSADVFGATAVVKAARQLESQSEQGNVQAITSLVGRLDNEVARLHDALTELL